MQSGYDSAPGYEVKSEVMGGVVMGGEVVWCWCRVVRCFGGLKIRIWYSMAWRGVV